MGERRLTASAISSEPIPSDYVDVHQVLGKNAADGISGGKKYNRLVILVGEHLCSPIWALVGFPKSLFKKNAGAKNAPPTSSCGLQHRVSTYCRSLTILCPQSNKKKNTPLVSDEIGVKLM
jgi:hypothetical protein